MNRSVHAGLEVRCNSNEAQSCTHQESKELITLRSAIQYRRHEQQCRSNHREPEPDLVFEAVISIADAIRNTFGLENHHPHVCEDDG